MLAEPVFCLFGSVPAFPEQSFEDTADFESQGKLARHLGRDPGNVGRDIDVLVDEGLVDRVQNGRAKKPVLTHDTYVVEPIVSTTSPTV
jgi:hypothetical protein